jgi:mono/diheme cytochrome c family protein
MRLLLLPLLVGPVFGDDLGAQAQAILQKNCLICHGAALQSAKLDLRSRESMIRGGERGPALNPGHPEVSRLYLFAAGIEQPSMPPGKKLAAEDLDVLRAWIKEGAKLDTAVEADTDRSAALAKLEERPILPQERAFWSFQPVKRPKASSIDELWLAALDAKGLKPNPPADKRSLIRRVYLDLIGLPPTPAQVRKFLDDASPNAFSKVVDELLASPHYGERWGRHWLDLVRYSDSAGYEFDRDRPTAHLYRDWVIQAFNRDMPYDEFLRMQIAGDLKGQREGIVAASYLRLGADPNLKTEQTRMDELDDLLATTSNAMFGMTVGCARCHNHKFDPIPQKDYYRMQAVFFSAKPADVPLVGPEEIAKHKEALKAWNATVEPTRQLKAELEKPYRDRLLQQKKDKLADYIKVALATPPEKRTEGQRLNAIQVEKTLRVEEKEVQAVLTAEDRAKWEALKAKLEAFENTKPILPTALGVEEKKIEPSYFLHHGSVDSKGSRMEPGVLSVASEGD